MLGVLVAVWGRGAEPGGPRRTGDGVGKGISPACVLLRSEAGVLESSVGSCSGMEGPGVALRGLEGADGTLAAVAVEVVVSSTSMGLPASRTGRRPG